MASDHFSDPDGPMFHPYLRPSMSNAPSTAGVHPLVNEVITELWKNAPCPLKLDSRYKREETPDLAPSADDSRAVPIAMIFDEVFPSIILLLLSFD